MKCHDFKNHLFFRGHVCLIVNVASKWGMTDKNYKQLQALHDKLAEEKGLRILGFPCNQFGSQVRYKISTWHSSHYVLFTKSPNYASKILKLLFDINPFADFKTIQSPKMRFISHVFTLQAKGWVCRHLCLGGGFLLETLFPWHATIWWWHVQRNTLTQFTVCWQITWSHTPGHDLEIQCVIALLKL